MRKIIALMLCTAALAFTFAGCAKTAPNIVFTATIEEVHDGSILVTTSDEVSFDKASVSFSPELKLSFELAVGQIVKLTILPQIAKSYPVQVIAVAIELISEPNIVFTATIEEIHDNSILVSTTDAVGFDKASVSFAPELKLSFKLAVGQVVKLTVLPQIRESYPVQATAVAIELVSEPASPDPAHPNYTVSYFRADSLKSGNWEFIVARAANPDMMLISSVRHIPVIVIDSAQALTDFITAGKEYFQFDIAYNESVSFTENAGKYDDAFFKDNKLLILYAQETSGSIRHEIKDAAISDSTLSVAVGTITPEVGTDDIAEWFILLDFPKTALDGVTKFDAHYA